VASAALPPRALARILIPMDDKQTDHLRAYGLTYWALERGLHGEWLLNYRGGAFLLRSLVAADLFTPEDLSDEQRLFGRTAADAAPGHTRLARGRHSIAHESGADADAHGAGTANRHAQRRCVAHGRRPGFAVANFS